MTAGTGETRVRTAQPRDLPALAGFEVAIAEASFGDDAVRDPAVHHKKVTKALERDQASMFVAEHTGSEHTGSEHTGSEVTGWLWLAFNTNFLTGARYANFRSLAVAPHAPPETAEALLEHALGYAREQGITEVVGRVHVDNVGMRMLYRRFGFAPAFLTMRWRSDGG